MTANTIICPLCNRVAPVIDMTPAPRFARCEACRALHVPKGPDPAVPAGKTPSKKTRARKPKET